MENNNKTLLVWRLDARDNIWRAKGVNTEWICEPWPDDVILYELPCTKDYPDDIFCDSIEEAKEIAQERENQRNKDIDDSKT